MTGTISRLEQIMPSLTPVNRIFRWKTSSATCLSSAKIANQEAIQAWDKVEVPTALIEPSRKFKILMIETHRASSNHPLRVQVPTKNSACSPLLIQAPIAGLKWRSADPDLMLHALVLAQLNP